MKKIKNVFWFVFFTVFFTYRIFLPDILDPYFYDTCSLSYIDAKIEKKLSRDSRNNREEIRKIDEKVATLGLTPEKAARFKKAAFRMVFLKQNKCSVPEDIEKEFFANLSEEEETGNKVCSADMFLDESNKKLAEISKFPDVYKKIEDQFSNSFRGNMSNPERIKSFDEKWKSFEYRKSTVLMVLQIEERKNHGCKDVNKPMKPFLMEYIESK